MREREKKWQHFPRSIHKMKQLRQTVRAQHTNENYIPKLLSVFFLLFFSLFLFSSSEIIYAFISLYYCNVHERRPGTFIPFIGICISECTVSSGVGIVVPPIMIPFHCQHFFSRVCVCVCTKPFATDNLKL